MPKEIIRTEKAPAAIGPYSQGTKVGGFVFASGQIALDPPSVFGWDWEQSWISSATLLARYGFARDLGAASGVGGVPAGAATLS